MKYQKRTYRLWITSLLIIFICIVGTAREGAVTFDAATALGKPTLTIVSRTPSSVSMKYSKVNGATGYQIYRATKQDGPYKKIKTTKELTYKDTSASSKTAYYYKVRAYKTGASKNTYGNFSAVKSVKAVLSKTTNLTAKASANGISLTWKTVSRATSYRVYRADSKNGTYEYVTSTKNLKYTDNNVKSGKTYYYKVRAYAVSNSIKYYGSYSSIASAKISNNTQTNNSYQQQVIDLVNKERKAAGLSALTTTSKLESAAMHRAKEIVKTFSHTRPDGTSFYTVLEEYGITYNACGENIAWGQRTPEEVMNDWMNSEGHRRNIMSSNYNKIGIGYYVVNNTAYWVQIFTN